jgi:hypothetical protein
VLIKQEAAGRRGEIGERCAKPWRESRGFDRFSAAHAGGREAVDFFYLPGGEADVGG